MARGSACIMGRLVRLSRLPTPTGYSPAAEWYRWHSKGIAGLGWYRAKQWWADRLEPEASSTL
jgi:hypothetical protein